MGFYRIFKDKSMIPMLKDPAEPSASVFSGSGRGGAGYAMNLEAALGFCYNADTGAYRKRIRQAGTLRGSLWTRQAGTLRGGSRIRHAGTLRGGSRIRHAGTLRGGLWFQVVRVMVQGRKLPIGIQDSERLIRNGYVYADKTEYVYRLAKAACLIF